MNTDFSFTADLEKAEEENGRYFLYGAASTTDVDLQDEIISATAIAQMASKSIGLPITTSHNHEFTDEIGNVVECNVKDNVLYIKAELDADDAVAMRTYKKVASGKHKVGFSVGGKILSVGRPFGKARRIIDGVDPKHYMVTSKPVNPNTFCVSLSKALDEMPDDEVTNINKSEVTMTLEEMLQNEELIAHIESEIAKATGSIEKAGAKFSTATKGALMDIHDNTSDVDVQAKVMALLNNPLLNEPELSDGDGDDSISDVVTPVENSVIDKSLEEKFDDLKKTLITEIKSAMTVTPKGTATIGESETPAKEITSDLSLGNSLREIFSRKN